MVLLMLQFNLYGFYNEAFIKTNKPPLESEIEKTLSLVDWKSIYVSKDLINYEKKGMYPL